jgi:hypothetical protein
VATVLSRPFSTTANRSRYLVTAVLLLATLGACASPAGEGKDDPLPVKSLVEAQAWVEELAQHTAQAAGIQINDEPIRPLFTSCVGKNGETAPDDRYTLSYAVHSNVPKVMHPEVVRKIRDLLRSERLRTTGYRETFDGQPDAGVDAFHPTSRYIVDVSTAGGDDRMVIGVDTPCLMPPASPMP